MTRSSVAALILAAGSSTRLGKPKQLLSFRGRTLLRHVAETALASRCDRVFVILGFESEIMKRELIDLPVEIVENPAWREGMGSSLRVGVSALPDTVDAALILVCDQPLITPTLVNNLVRTFASTDKLVVACEYAGTVGVPVIFARPVFPELLHLQGDRGAKHLISEHLGQAAYLPFPEGAVDIDTLDDSARLASFDR